MRREKSVDALVLSVPFPPALPGRSECTIGKERRQSGRCAVALRRTGVLAGEQRPCRQRNAERREQGFWHWKRIFLGYYGPRAAWRHRRKPCWPPIGFCPIPGKGSPAFLSAFPISRRFP